MTVAENVFDFPGSINRFSYGVKYIFDILGAVETGPAGT